MRPAQRFFALGPLIFLALAPPAAAQYMRITTDNPGDPTRLRSGGATTVLTITVDTVHDRNGAVQSCNSHSAANGCGTIGTGAPIEYFSYTILLKAIGGLVTWGAFTPADPAYTPLSGLRTNDHEAVIDYARPPGTATPAGLSTVGTLPVTVLSGWPRVDISNVPVTLDPGLPSTFFGTFCSASTFPNSYALGDPADPCGAATGFSGDWFDADGTLAPAPPNSPPVLDPIQNMTVSSCGAGTADQPIRATDPDGDAITFTSSGPFWMTLTSAAQVGNVRTGNIHLAPPSTASGTFGASVTAASGTPSLSDTKNFTITITATNCAPSLAQPADMTVAEGGIADQTLVATDANGNPLTFSKVAGNTFMTVTTTSPGTGTATGNINLAPGFTDAGTYQATVRASDGLLNDDKSFSITVNNTDRPVSLAAINNMTLTPGSTADQTFTATDLDGDAMTFTHSGPTFMTRMDNAQSGTTRTGNIHLAPSSTTSGTFAASVTAMANGATSIQNFTIIICAGCERPPVLFQPGNMFLAEGATADQMINATDPDGNAVTFSKAAGPYYMAVTTTNPGVGTATGNIHLAPGFNDAGTAGATVTASDGVLSDSKSFSITVSSQNRPPVLSVVSNMSVCEGSTGDQTLSAFDPDGDPLTFSKVAGPTYMTVFTMTTTTGRIYLAPGFADAGTAAATVRVSDGFLNGFTDRSFTITVLGCERAPVLAQPADMTVLEGSTADQAFTATDPDGDAITFTHTGPTFMTRTDNAQSGTTRTGNIHLAPSSTTSGTFSASLTASDGTLTDSKSFTITVVPLGCAPPFLAQPSNMTVNEAAAADQVLYATNPDGNPVTFAKVAGPTFVVVTTTSPTTGNVRVAPGFSDAGSYVVTVRASISIGTCTASVDKAFTLVVYNVNRPPTLNPIPTVTVKEGETVDVPVTASDPDNDPLTFSSGGCGMFLVVDSVTRILHIAPPPNSAGTYACSVTVSDGQTSVTQSFVVIVLPAGNRCPVAAPGGPYSGLAGVPVSFDGTASFDPDGNPLTYAWDFDASDGITIDAVGATPSHTYSVAGSFTVTLTVTDNGNGNPAQVCSRSATTTATIAPVCDATVFNGYDTIKLGTGKPFWFAFVQPANTCYRNSDVVIASFIMKYAGRQISASGRISVGEDKNGDGIQEIRISFSKADLRTLFTGTGLGNGHNLVTVTLEANLVTGGRIRGTTQLDIVNDGGFNVAVSPNPLNPQATLTWTTSRVGFARIDLFDIQGRLVRRLVDEPSMAAGVHEATIDGKNQRGESLTSGIYFIRGTLLEGEFKEIITILK